MKISSRTHYGLRAMTELAKSFGQRTLSLSEIAAVEHLPQPYLEQLISPLRRAGLVEARRGVHGGYRLARAPETIMISEVVQALEGPDATAPVECVRNSYVDGSCVREKECVSRTLWGRLKDAYDQILFNTSLADLCREGRSGVEMLNLSPDMLSTVRHLKKEQTVPNHG